MMLSRVRELGAGVHGKLYPDRSQCCSVKPGTGAGGQRPAKFNRDAFWGDSGRTDAKCKMVRLGHHAAQRTLEREVVYGKFVV